MFYIMRLYVATLVKSILRYFFIILFFTSTMISVEITLPFPILKPNSTFEALNAALIRF